MKWAPAALVVVAFNLFWYGAFLSFPLFSEDGGAAYSFLTEALQYERSGGSPFSLKWLHGLGQLSVVATVTYDPFSWVIFSGLRAADAFRVSYALRATVCWVTTYFFIMALFRRAWWVAATGASLAMLLSFTLSHPSGIPTFAATHIATEVALFPGLLWLYLRIVKQRTVIGWVDVAFIVSLILFLLIYPFGSLLGLASLFAFAIGFTWTARKSVRPRAAWGLIKLLLFSALVLFSPWPGIYQAWRVIAQVSARYVFAAELTTYPRDYVLPLLWHDVPLGVRVVVLMATSVIFLRSRWPHPLRAVVASLGLIVVGVQLLTIARAWQMAPDLFDRLPRPFYAEFYVPVFYAACAAYSVHRLYPKIGPRLARMASFAAAAWLLVGAWVFWLPGRQNSLHQPLRRSRRLVWLVPLGAVTALFAGAVATWRVWPEGIHPVFFADLLCRRGTLWCDDRPGRSMGAARNPITDFLRAHLVGRDRVFRGRADYLLPRAPLEREQEVGVMVRERNRNFRATGNGMLLRALPFHGIPVASSYEQALDYLYYLIWTRYVNEGIPARRSINMTNLEEAQPERLRLIGLRYVIVREDYYNLVPHLSRVFAWNGYAIFEIEQVNTSGYAPTRVVFANSLAQEFLAMREPTFDSRKVAVVAESERNRFDGAFPLSPLASSIVRISGQTLLFDAISNGGYTLAVLPFKFSHCWLPKWKGPPGALIRVDGGLIGVLFKDATHLRLKWSAGYGLWASCMAKDRDLVEQAIATAAQIR